MNPCGGGSLVIVGATSGMVSVAFLLTAAVAPAGGIEARPSVLSGSAIRSWTMGRFRVLSALPPSLLKLKLDGANERAPGEPCALATSVVKKLSADEASRLAANQKAHTKDASMRGRSMEDIGIVKLPDSSAGSEDRDSEAGGGESKTFQPVVLRSRRGVR